MSVVFSTSFPKIIVAGTVLQPIVAQAGIELVRFDFIVLVSLALRLITPPYGRCLLVASAVVNVEVVTVLKDIIIMLCPMLLVLDTADTVILFRTSSCSCRGYCSGPMKS